MNLFWQEFTLFIVSVFALLVGVSAGWLFLVTARYEKQLNTFWRSLGFFSLGIAFFNLCIFPRGFIS